MSTKHMTSHQLDRERPDYTTWSHAALQARHRELRAQILRDFPMPATETDEEAHIQRLLQEVKERTTPATPTHLDAPAVDGNELLQEVTQFIARYLQCSQHQLTLLALWVLHTYCFCAARVTPYLAIRSADKQSGKTLCLQLLSLLCDHAALTSGGFTPRDLAVPMKEKPIAALLFDECHLTVGTRARPRSPALRAVLAGSFHLGVGHRNIAEDRNAFVPKAFAGSGPLPEELADRCIPIILEPLDAHVAQPPSAVSSIERFDLHHVADQIKPLRDRLERWAKNHFSLLTNRTLLPRFAFPPNLSPRQQDLCDPLLQIAALVGGPWIARALQACAVVFDLQSIFELRPNLQLLADVRDCFAYHNWPDRLPTEVLQDWTDSLPPRPWDADGPLNPRQIAHLLRAFHIHPREHRLKSPVAQPQQKNKSGAQPPGSPARGGFSRDGVEVPPAASWAANPLAVSGRDRFARGYELKDFQEPWQKYFPQSTIANKNKGCDTSTHNSPVVKTSVQTPVEKGVTLSPARKDDLPNLVKPRVADPSLPAANSQPLAAQPKNKRRKVATPDRTAEPILTERQKAGRATQQPSATTQGSLTANCQPPIAQIAPAQQPRPNEILPGITCGDVFDDRWLHAFRR